MYTEHAKKSRLPQKNLANFSKTIERKDIQFYTLVIHSVTRKPGKFHYIIYRTNNTMLILVMAT